MKKTNSSLTTTPNLWLIAHIDVLTNITVGLSSLAVDPSAANLADIAVHVGTFVVELALDPALARRARRLALRSERPARPLRRRGTPGT